MPIVLASTATVGSSGAFAVEFTNISQNGKDLLILVSSRAENFNGRIRLNGSTTGYSYRELFGSGSSVGSYNGSNDTAIAVTALHEPRDFNGVNNTVGIFSNASIYISNYTSSAAKSISVDTVVEMNQTESYQAINGATWSGTAPVTSLTISASSGVILQNTTISVYVVDAVGATSATPVMPAPKATGGTITLSGGFFYHTFTGSGTLAVTQTIPSAEMLVISGGGGGGSNGSQAGGGGGAGGLRLFTQSVSTGNYAITVGAGGTGSTSGGGGQTDGNPSSIGTLGLSTSGGGYGAQANDPAGAAGGSGGGGGADWGDNQAWLGGTAVSGEGNNGGSGRNTTTNGVAFGGGGGGSGAAGANATTTSAGAGGIGTNAYSVWAAATGTGVNGRYAAGGGGGAGPNNNTRGLGGDGGGGNGSTTGLSNTPGAANTGSGGGGQGRNNTEAATTRAGGSGIVIVRYAA